MCGIAGIISEKEDGVPFLLNALGILKTRGYDGFGIYVEGSEVIRSGWDELEVIKKVVASRKIKGTVGIAHNRWANHGVVDVINAHPHVVDSIIVVHNGDIDNADDLREQLIKEGYTFNSDTDTEVFAALVAKERKQFDFFTSVKNALLNLGPTSTYAFLIMDTTDPGKIIATCKGSRPLLFSLKNGTTYIASEAAALAGLVQMVQELNKGDIAIFESGKLIFRENMTGQLEEKFNTYEINVDDYKEPGNTSEYHMYSEMKDAVNVIKKAIGRRATPSGIVLGGIGEPEIQQRLRKIEKFFIAGCGTSYYAGQIIAECLREIAHIEAEAIVASEAIYQTRIFDPEKTALVVISQSGGTADVARLMEEWEKRGMLMLGIVNKPNTQIPNMTHAGIYCHIGAEIAVPSTKAFLGEIICGIMFAISMGQQRGSLTVSDREKYINALLALPQQAKLVLQNEAHVAELAKKYANSINFLFMGRGYSSSIAFEGALKLKEITWKDGIGVHAVGIPAGEMKHGTLAMISEKFPTFVIAPCDSVFTATMSNVSEIMARKGPIILITDDIEKVSNSKLTEVIVIPKTLECMSPVLSAIIVQMFAFYMAIERKCNPDLPKNLAKSVTVE